MSSLVRIIGGYYQKKGIIFFILKIIYSDPKIFQEFHFEPVNFKKQTESYKHNTNCYGGSLLV